MNILINDERIEFTLENEKNLQDILNSIEKWLQQSKMTITRVKLDGKYISPSDLPNDAARSVKDIQTIEFNASPMTTFRIEEIQSLLQYLVNLKEAVQTLDKKQLEVLLPVYPDARDSLYQYFHPKKEPGKENIIDILTKYIEGSTMDMIVLLNDKDREEIISSIDMLGSALYDIAQKLSPKKTELSLDYLEELKPTVAQLNEIPILLQTGKDAQAMESLALFSEVAQNFLVMVSGIIGKNKMDISIDGQSFEEFSVALNDLLRELISAFDKKDYILIGDLCEYEIAPRIEKLIESVQKELSV
ncbi:MAG: hypothetical protein JW904_10040 [Spirochaetales bacterium]|nr:hypothetical protein [Spirochaetales bacterium]